MDRKTGPFTDILMHCLPGWRAVFCVLDNCVPHHDVAVSSDDPEEPAFTAREAHYPFRLVCRLHDMVIDRYYERVYGED